MEVGRVVSFTRSLIGHRSMSVNAQSILPNTIGSDERRLGIGRNFARQTRCPTRSRPPGVSYKLIGVLFSALAVWHGNRRLGARREKLFLLSRVTRQRRTIGPRKNGVRRPAVPEASLAGRSKRGQTFPNQARAGLGADIGVRPGAPRLTHRPWLGTFSLIP